MHSWYGVSASAWGSDAKQSWFEIMMCKTFTQKELVIRCLAHSSPDLIMSWTALLWEDCWLGARGHEIFERQIAVWHIHNYTYCICISHHISIILFSFMQVVGYRPISVSISIPPSEPHQWDGCEQRPPILHGNTCNMATPIQSPNSELIYIYIFNIIMTFLVLRGCYMRTWVVLRFHSDFLCLASQGQKNPCLSRQPNFLEMRSARGQLTYPLVN